MQEATKQFASQLQTLSELTVQQQKQKDDLLKLFIQSYLNEFDSSSTDTSTFTTNDLNEYLGLAAEIVILIRWYVLNKSNEEPLTLFQSNHLRHESSSHPLNSPKQYIHSLIHSCFVSTKTNDNIEYMQPLNKELTDELIEQVQSWQSHCEKQRTITAGSVKQDINNKFEIISQELSNVTSVDNDKISQELLSKLENVDHDMATLLHSVSLLKIARTQDGLHQNAMAKWHSAPQEVPATSSASQQEIQEHVASTEDGATTATAESSPKVNEAEPKSQEVPAPSSASQQESQGHAASTEDGAATATTESTPVANQEDGQERSTSTDEAKVNQEEQQKEKEQEQTKLQAIEKVEKSVTEKWQPFIERYIGRVNAFTPSASGDDQINVKDLKALHRGGLEAVEALTKALLTLDAINSGSSDTVRLKRKEQVVRIQKLIDDVDPISKRVAKMVAALPAPVSPPASTTSSSAAEAPSSERPSSSQTQMQDQSSKVSEQEMYQAEDEDYDDESEREIDWRKATIEPEFETTENARAYVISAYLPGLNKEDIEIKVRGVNNERLQISGFRGPNAAQARQLAAKPNRGNGVFGSFSEEFEIPRGGVSINDIEATYERGVLNVIIPKAHRPTYHQPKNKGFPFANNVNTRARAPISNYGFDPFFTNNW